VRDIPKSNFHEDTLVSEDITCAVCDGNMIFDKILTFKTEKPKIAMP
jgi:hypothetical protein